MTDFDKSDIARRLAICEAATQQGKVSARLGSGDNVCTTLATEGDVFIADFLPQWVLDELEPHEQPLDHLVNLAFVEEAWTGYPAALRALQAAQEELRHARQVNTCDVCNGTGRPLSGGSCMCGGTGRMSDAALVLRADLVEARAEIERLRGFEAEAMAARRMLDVYDAAEMSYQCEACAALSTCKEWSIYAAARAANEQPPQGGEAATP